LKKSAKIAKKKPEVRGEKLENSGY